jgi:hypothetical protein
MLPLIYTTPAYTITFVIVIVITRIPEIIRANRWRPQRDPTARQVDGGSLVVMSIVVGGGVIVACLLATVWTGATIPWLRPQVTLAGIVVILAGELIGLGYRVRVEERALVDALGQPCVDYMRHSKRFIPLVF